MVKMIISMVALVALVGCSRENLTLKEREERNQVAFREAIQAEKQGDFAEAIKVYDNLILEQPGLASAHLSLARLFHDKNKDYVNALYHYRAYLKLASDTQKTQLVQARINMATHMLAAEMAQKADRDKEIQVLLDERNRSLKQLAVSETALATAKTEVEVQKKTIDKLNLELIQLRKLVEQMRSDSLKAQGATRQQIQDDVAAAKALAATVRETPPAPARPTRQVDTSKASIDEVRADILKMIAEQDGGANEADDAAVLKQAQGAKKSQTAAPAAPAAKQGRIHVVKPGESLSSIARAYYGKASRWSDILNANKTTINPNGRLAVGQKVVIP